jgi:hypothetical protein
VAAGGFGLRLLLDLFPFPLKGPLKAFVKGIPILLVPEFSAGSGVFHLPGFPRRFL